jgi:hypothetical protein
MKRHQHAPPARSIVMYRRSEATPSWSWWMLAAALVTLHLTVIHPPRG